MSEKTEKQGKKNLPLPMAPIVRLMKKSMDKEKLIKSQVKVGMNEWLASVCESVSKEMNKTPYTSIDYTNFKQAIQAYEDVEEMKREKERIIVSLQKIKEDCDSLIRDLDRKFKV